ncbi:MAG: TIM barrel protein, partial [Bryobacteraceae bacterium]|nr:TIM barrel protein [Bryobacteraceae bacterium]
DYLEAQDLAAIRSEAERLGIEIATVAGYTDFTAGRRAPEVPFVEMQLLSVRELCRCARELGAGIVRVFSGYYTDLSDHHSDWVRCVTALREAADLAADYGVTLGLQNHHDVGVAVGSFADLLDDVDHPHLKAMFDPWSIGLHGADLYTAAKRMAPRMVQTTLAEFIDLAAACRVFLTNDSGAMHVAAALGVPTVAVFGATDPEATGPVGPAVRVVREPVECSPCLLRECPIDHRCMTRVLPARVAQEARELLK